MYDVAPSYLHDRAGTLFIQEFWFGFVAMHHLSLLHTHSISHLVPLRGTSGAIFATGSLTTYVKYRLELAGVLMARCKM